MQREQVECLTLENADFKTGQVYKIGGLLFLSVPVIVAIMQIAIIAILSTTNPGLSFLNSASTGPVLFSAGAFIGPALYMWWKFHQRDRVFCAMFNDPKGKELLKEGQRLADQIFWLTEAEETIASGLNNLNLTSGGLGQGTPECIRPVYKTLTDECTRLRTVLHEKAVKLREEQDGLLRKLRADHGFPELPASPPETSG
ncbi:MAG: hypothetical protein WC802_03680 [Patescibacteria group bacterium]|jgi:hypothetical protein